MRSGALRLVVRFGLEILFVVHQNRQWSDLERLLLIKTCFNLPPGIANETQINEGLLTFSAFANKKARL